MTEPIEPAQPSRRAWWLVGAAGAALVAAVIVLVVSLTGEKDHVVDEQAWRQAREAQGTEFVDWRLYADTFVNKVCPDEDFGFFVAGRLDDGATEEQLRTDFTYACPSRLPDFDKEIRDLEDPCAGMSPEDEALFEEAMGDGYAC